MANSAWSRRVAAARQRSAQRTLRRIASAIDFALVRQGDDVVELHGDVAAELFLNGDGLFGRELDAVAVDVRAKDGALLVDRRPVGEAEDLKAAAVGEDRAVPAHDRVQPAEGGDRVRPRAEQQMIRVGEDHLRAGFAQAAGVDALHRGLRADRHERRHVDGAMRRGEAAQPRGRTCVLVKQLEIEIAVGPC